MPTLKLGSTTAITESGGTLTYVRAGGLRSMQVFTSTSNVLWTKPAGISTIKVYCTGAGGGGGAPGNSWDSGGGGGAGGTAIRIYDVSSVANVTIIVGGSGAGGGTDGSSTDAYEEGVTGGTSSFAGPSQTITATGGGGGWDGNSGAAGGGDYGVGLNGQLNLRGEQGSSGNDHGTSWAHSGHGGSCFWGGAPNNRVNQAAHPTNVDATHGNGGGGGTSQNSATYMRGGNGGDGLIVVEEYS
jgi:hypothetical protein|tara:strand:+ start:4259 stop:4984 length:726 start_codon:yes stop_codon:yes gene_type:complete